MSRRPSFTRAERVARGLPVCIVDGCDRAPHRLRLCWHHYYDPSVREAAARQRRPRGTPRASRSWKFRVDLMLAISLEAERRGVNQTQLLEDVLTPIAATWGAPASRP